MCLQDLSLTESCQSTAPVTISAHQNDIAALAVNQQGSLVATASVKVLPTAFDLIMRCITLHYSRLLLI